MRADMPSLLQDARDLMWKPVPIRRGDSALSVLHVVRPENAHQDSLSAMVGDGQQPLHTDGAHHREMPDIVLLAAQEPTSTPTLLCNPGYPTDAQRAGTFRVGRGREAFYANAVDDVGRWRYDPGCMTPMDDDARRASLDFDELRTRAVRHEWAQPGTVLVIANRRTLHARASAVDSHSRRMYRSALISRLDR